MDSKTSFALLFVCVCLYDEDANSVYELIFGCGVNVLWCGKEQVIVAHILKTV